MTKFIIMFFPFLFGLNQALADDNLWGEIESCDAAVLSTQMKDARFKEPGIEFVRWVALKGGIRGLAIVSQRICSAEYEKNGWDSVRHKESEWASAVEDLEQNFWRYCEELPECNDNIEAVKKAANMAYSEYE